MPALKPGKGKGAGKPRSRSARAGTVFPVGRLSRHLKAISPHLRRGAGAPVYLAAVIEYLSAEILELAGNSARDNRRRRIKPRDIRLAVGNDTELNKLCGNVTFSEGGSMALIHKELIPGATKSSSKKSVVRASASPKAAKFKVKPKKPVPTMKNQKQSPKDSMTTGATSGTAPSGSANPSPSLPVLSEGSLFLGQKLSVLMGNISVVSAEAIVHPTNATYSTSGQVGQVLKTAGQVEYEVALDSLRTQGNLNKCGASICDMFHIEAKKIIHCNCPSWNDSQDVLDLQKTVENCLKLADKENLKSIALPSVGSGNAGWPKQLAAETILRAIDRYFQTIMASSIKNVFFVLYDKESVDIYTTELKRLLDGSS
ncbi:core histone macro-H2A.1-like [Watersipora subatra]|uniref:core histone macro-H2A.1-like n=1 Tax=Watersipora subatra TaxID=2589382 RepID=UPI00355C68BF